MDNVAEKRLLSAKEAAKFLGISRKTIYNELSAGRFPVKVKRHGKKLLFERKDLERYADSL
jgi:excisionase family DNA binding protein